MAFYFNLLFVENAVNTVYFVLQFSKAENIHSLTGFYQPLILYTTGCTMIQKAINAGFK